MDHNSDKLLYLFEENESIMGRFYLFMLILLPVFALYGKEIPQDIQGFVNDNGEILFEVSGYTFSVYEMRGTVDDEITMRLVEKAYGLNHIVRTYTDSALRTKNKIVESLIVTPFLPVRISQKCFLLQKDNKWITVLYLETSLDRDLKIEKEILTAFLNGKLTSCISHGKATSKITLAGKKINLLVDAEWIAPHGVVYEDAQISWSEFSSKSRADQYISNQIMIDKKGNTNYVKDEELFILLDKKTEKARRIVYYGPFDELLADYLIVYYFVYRLRGQSVACILSCYEDSEDVLFLPPLLESVIQIPPSVDNEYKKQNSGSDDYRGLYMTEFYLGAMRPLGSLTDVYNIAPSFGWYMGIPVARRMAIDMGFGIAVPVNSNFEYFHADNSSEYGKAQILVGGNLRWRNLLRQRNEWSFWGYLGVGGSLLVTNIVDEDSYDSETNTYEHYSITSLDLLAGFSIRYKSFGIFAEYHYIPYGSSNKLKYTFGHSSIHAGVSILIPWMY